MASTEWSHRELGFLCRWRGLNGRRFRRVRTTWITDPDGNRVQIGQPGGASLAHVLVPYLGVRVDERCPGHSAELGIANSYRKQRFVRLRP
jgi:hypothetical protein